MGRVDRVATQFHGKLVAASFDPLRRTDVKGYYPFTLALRGPFGTVGLLRHTTPQLSGNQTCTYYSASTVCYVIFIVALEKNRVNCFISVLQKKFFDRLL